MRIALIGSGGREHAIAAKIRASKHCDELFCMPGNAGTAEIAINIPVDVEDTETIVKLCRTNRIDLAVIGPENPLAAGVVDKLTQAGIRAFGPTKEGARIEASKSFTKKILKKYGIPTAGYETFDNYDDAARYVRKRGAPIVVKADGLAAGKGVTVAHSVDEALSALDDIFLKKRFKEAGRRVVIEEMLTGQEASFLAFTDSKTLLPLIAAQDHKPVFDNDKGPNTGGMGAYAPAPIVDDNLKKRIIEEIMERTLHGLKQEGIVYKGVLYAGLMIDKDKNPYVLEFNCRFGDPETQAILPLLKTDIVELFLATIDSNLSNKTLDWKQAYAVCVVLASGGYPGSYHKGLPISGLDRVKKLENVEIYHAGTAIEEGHIVTAGGRVLNVVGIDKDFDKARKRAYEAINMIHFDNMHYRKDIGAKAYEFLTDGEV